MFKKADLILLCSCGLRSGRSGGVAGLQEVQGAAGGHADASGPGNDEVLMEEGVEASEIKDKSDVIFNSTKTVLLFVVFIFFFPFF